MFYYPYISDKPNKKYFIITNDNRKVYFGASGYEHYTDGHLDEKRKQAYIKRHKKRKIGIILIVLVIGLINSFGYILQKKKHTSI